MTDLTQWLISHYRELAAQTSVRAVAMRFKKQGWPLWVALLILCGRSER